MALTFADTHNMIAYLTKSDASEGFDQIINFLNASSIKYALTVNPNFYVSCIKQFWTSISVKKVNDVPRLQALVDKKKVIITEATIRDALRLDDAKGIDCLLSEEIFAELSRMGYEKPSTKLTFYKAFFSPQWKFLIHTIPQCMSANRTSWNEFSSSMALAVICLFTSRKFNFSKYIFDSPVRNMDSPTNFYMVAKGCSRVETPLFEGMIVAPQAGKGAVEVNVDNVSAVGVADEGGASVTVDDVPAAADEPTIPLPTSPTQPPPPSQDQPSTSQVQPTPPQAQPPSPQQQPQPSQDAEISMDLLHNMLDTCITLTRRVENLEQDKIAQALEITKLKQRVKKLERRNKLKGRIMASMDADVDVTLKDVADIAKEVVVDAEIEESVDVQGRQAKSIRLTSNMLTSATVTAANASITAAAPTLTTAPSAARRRKGVVIRDPKETATPSTIIHTEPKSKEKGKGIMVYEPKPLKKKTQIEQDEAYAREYQALKRKPQTEAQARKKMMIYLRNMAGFKMDYFKGMTYDEIRPIFEKKFNSNVAFLEKTRKQIEEEDSKALKRISESQEDKAAKKQNLDEEVPIVDYRIHTENSKPYFKIIRADGTHQLFLSFLSLLRNFDREDLEVLWELVKESKGQNLETVRVLWSAHYHIYFYADDPASREKISTHKVHSGLNAQQLQVVSVVQIVKTVSIKVSAVVYKCGDPNHFTGECPNSSRSNNQNALIGGAWSDNGKDEKEKAKDKTCLVAQASNEICLGINLEPDEWIKDSGCSKHMMGKGMISHDSLIIENVENVDNLKFNLLSVGQICDNKCNVVFTEHDSEIIKDEKVIGRGIRKRGLNKARLVAQGYNQQKGIDYDETYAPIARLESIRILLAYACALDFKLFQMDVKSAFFNGFINEEVYVAQPPGFIDLTKPNHDYRLKKGLYGLKQAPKAWYDRLKDFLIKHDYSMGMVDNTLFTKKKDPNLIIVQIYVDDIIFGSTCQEMCDDFFKIMHDEFEMRCCLTFWFLKKQTALAISTTEAEYVSTGKAYQQALWMKQALVDYGIRLDDLPIMCDNRGAIDLSKNPVQHSRTKHINIRHHFLHDNVQKGNISIEKVSSEDNIADILTKPLKREPFNYLRLGLGMMEQID
uniref:Copia protein n=1 Tax=Tanacetum cinerariifolium TaxID=118510 RepID=A0A6L2K7I3_TANCI|nr:copia protein [Tanacetum cinerariifolium]